MVHHLSARACVPPHRKIVRFYNGVYSFSEKLHIICICTNGLWVVRCSVSAVMQHCMHTNRYNTQHTIYMPCVSLNAQQTTNCMQHSAVTEANSSTASQQIWNRKVHCCVHNSPTIVLILYRKNPNMFNPSGL